MVGLLGEWSDGFNPNGKNKDNRGGVHITTISLFARLMLLLFFFFIITDNTYLTTIIVASIAGHDWEELDAVSKWAIIDAINHELEFKGV